MKRKKKKKKKLTHMEMRRVQNLKMALVSRAENWMFAKLKCIQGVKWIRQYVFGYRIFDFFDKKWGIAVEVDGPEHDEEYDTLRDDKNRDENAVIIYRVNNFDGEDAKFAISRIRKFIKDGKSWAVRKSKVRVREKTKLPKKESVLFKKKSSRCLVDRLKLKPKKKVRIIRKGAAKATPEML